MEKNFPALEKTSEHANQKDSLLSFEKRQIRHILVTFSVLKLRGKHHKTNQKIKYNDTSLQRTKIWLTTPGSTNVNIK